MDYEDESETQRVLDSGSSIVGASGNRTDDALQSYIGRVNYGFKSRYLLTASFRVDGSSRFADDNRWGYFPAVSAGWRLSEESFFDAFPSFISNLKLTAGWGRSGNQSVARLQYLGLFGRGARYSFGGESITGVNLVRIPNPNISWETAEMTNFALETAFFNYALRAKVEYFVKNTKDVLLAPPTVGMIGTATVPDVNVGQIDNRGVEFEIDYNYLFGELDFNVFANASINRNKVVAINEEFLASRTYGRPNQEISRTFEGEPIATFYGWRTNGLYQTQAEIDADPNIANDPRRESIEPGDVRFLDLNGDNLIDGDDREIIGNPHPAVTYGFGTQLGYGSFDLRLFFVGAGGVDIYNADRMQGLDPTYPFNMYQEVENRWHGEGTSNSIPRMTTQRTNLNHRTSDLFVERGDFVRLKSFTVQYTLPRSLASRAGFSQARIYVTGQNVFTLTSYSGIDPELGYSDGNLQRNVDFAQYPQPRMWTLGLAVDM
jgi:TonB-linked SusC/RagA family outer membrane protein